MSGSSSQGSSAARGEQRHTARVFCKLSVRIVTHDPSGKELDVFGYSEVVTRDGGLICSPVPLAQGMRIVVERDGRRSTARVVGQLQAADGKPAYGIHLQTASGAPFWGIEFPPPAVSSVGSKLLECTRCHGRVVVELGEIEMMVFENGRTLGRQCQHCATETLWQEPELDLVFGNDAYSAPVAVKRERTSNDRRHARIAMKKIKACIKRANCADEVVDVIDISRGGIRFQSFRNYDAGTMMEVAVPYTEGGANVYTPAQIVRVARHSRDGFPGDYGAAYVRS